MQPDPSERARALQGAAVRLSGLGQPDDARAAASEAVEILRALAAQHPDTGRSDLATALLVLANCLEASGKMPDALAATIEALRLHAGLTGIDPGLYSAQAAQSSRDYIARCDRAGQPLDMDMLADTVAAFQRFQASRDDGPA
jgi:tetratricopeptide (TPR) repeat protein